LSSRRLRLGVIGAGSWTVGSHLPALARHSNEVEFAIVNRRDPERLERIRSGFGFERSTTDWHAVIDARPDLIVIGTPPAQHYEQVRAALAVGAHVLCEKPFTLDPSEAWRLAEIAEKVDRQIVLALGWNYRPVAIRAAELMADPGIGRLEELTVHMASATRELLSPSGGPSGGDPSEAPRADTWVDPRLSGGGYAQAQLSHALGLALWLTGLRGAEVFAYLFTPPGNQVELHDSIAVRFTTGAIGTLSGGSAHLGAGGGRHQLEIRAIGREGQLHLDLERDLLWLYRESGDDIRVPLPVDAGAYDCVGPVDELIALARGRGTNRSPAELGARTVELTAAAYASARSRLPQPI
jgi:predicted dehydrogenase